VKRELIREFVVEDTCEVEDEDIHEVDTSEVEVEGVHEVEDEGTHKVEGEGRHEVDTCEVEDDGIQEVEDEVTREVEDEDMELDLFCYEDVVSTEDSGCLTTCSKGCKLLFTEHRERWERELTSVMPMSSSRASPVLVLRKFRSYLLLLFINESDAEVCVLCTRRPSRESQLSFDRSFTAF